MHTELRRLLRFFLWLMFVAALIGGGRHLEDEGLAIMGRTLLYITIAVIFLRPFFDKVTLQKS